jgi:hypothetical protein
MLRCEECEREARSAEEAPRLRAYLSVIKGDEPEEVAAYCPAECAEREFGPPASPAVFSE